MAVIPRLLLTVCFKTPENGAEISRDESQGQANEMHHPELSLWHRLQIKDTLLRSGNSRGTGQSSE